MLVNKSHVFQIIKLDLYYTINYTYIYCTSNYLIQYSIIIIITEWVFATTKHAASLVADSPGQSKYSKILFTSLWLRPRAWNRRFNVLTIFSQLYIEGYILGSVSVIADYMYAYTYFHRVEKKKTY